MLGARILDGVGLRLFWLDKHSDNPQGYTAISHTNIRYHDNCLLVLIVQFFPDPVCSPTMHHSPSNHLASLQIIR